MSQQMTVPPTRAEFRSLKDCRNLSEAFQCGELMERIKASAPSHVKPQRMLRTFIQATSKAPLLLQCSMRSVLGAMLTCSEVGLEPNTPLQHAFLIPFGKYKWNKASRERELVGYEVQLIFGYPGLLDLSYRSGQVTSVHADVAYKDEYDNGRFKFEYGTNSILSHRPERARGDDETPMFGYAHASLKTGQAFHVMPWHDILKIRNGSQGFRSALAAKEKAEASGWKLPATWTEAPWVKYERKMAGKTVFRALSTWLPKSVELAGVLALDESQDRGAVDFSAVLDGEVSIADGGYQESGPLVEDESDPTATFGLHSVANDPQPEREPPPKKPAEPKPEPKPRPAATRSKPVEVEPPRVEAPPPIEEPPPAEEEPAGPRVDLGQPGVFSAWLVDGDGVPFEAHNERFTDPVAYANALVETLATAFPGDVELIRMANADDAAEAARMSPEAAAILTPKPTPVVEEPPIQEDPITEPVPQQDVPPSETDPLQLAPPPTANKAGWEAWIATLTTLLATVTTPDAYSRVVELNEPMYREFPAKYRLAAKGALDAKQQALTRRPMPTPQEIYAGLMRDIEACKTADALKGLETNSAIVKQVATLRVASPELCDQVQSAARAKFKEFALAAGARPAVRE